MINIVKIGINGDMIDIKISNAPNLLKVLVNVCCNKGYNNIQLLYKWVYNDYNINIYGWIDGDINKVNLHNLPINGDSNIITTNSNEIKLYGDIIIIKTNIKGVLYDILSEDYGEFYNIIYNYKDSNSDSDSDCESDLYDDHDYGIDYNSDVDSDTEVTSNNINIIKAGVKSVFNKNKNINKICNSLGLDNNTYINYKQ